MKADVKYLMEWGKDPFSDLEDPPRVWILYCSIEYQGQNLSYQPVAVFSSDWDGKAFARFVWDGGKIDVGNGLRELFESQDNLKCQNKP